jgi:hypothetical protein
MKVLKLSLLVSLFAASAGANSYRGTAPSTRDDFLAYVRQSPAEVFSTEVGPKVEKTVRAYAIRERLPNGRAYGDSVRSYSLLGKSSTGIRADMSAKGCPLREDVLRAPATNLPIIYAGKTLPLWIFLCPDGGFVRVKPMGDPTNSHRTGVHGSKGLRYPYDSKFENFEDEVVKVDNAGNAVPKSIRDLKPKNLIDGWAADAHSDLAH